MHGQVPGYVAEDRDFKLLFAQVDRNYRGSFFESGKDKAMIKEWWALSFGCCALNASLV